MALPRPARRLVLTAHIVTSVGWLGAVAGYVALDLTAATTGNPDTARTAHVAMDIVLSRAIVPLAIASVAVGIINALGTSWGLFRHYWVVVKLAATVVATAVLLAEAPAVSDTAARAAAGAPPDALSGSLAHSIGGLAVLVAVTAISVFKPRGETPYGWRRRRQRPAG